MRKIGLIGAGNMGSAILRGIISADYVKAGQVIVCDKSIERMEELSAELPQAAFCDDPAELAAQADVVLLAVKPNIMAHLIETIRDALSPEKVVISIAAGWTVPMLQAALGDCGASLLRVMPNTPALVGEGMTALCAEHTLSEEDFAFARGIFDAVGRTVVVPEKQFDGVIAISGSSPAYVFMMIEAMADAGVREGLPRKTAYEMAAQAVLGSALMVLSSGDHPGALKDAVCSPAGTTIDAVAVLEKCGFRSAVMEAMHACAEKSRNMSK